uniref:Uncharacterized protein n=1 Tax=Anguilla anguilla TaxID=7936 RepID=A0A0E9XFV4_ANGAN
MNSENKMGQMQTLDRVQTAVHPWKTQ